MHHDIYSVIGNADFIAMNAADSTCTQFFADRPTRGVIGGVSGGDCARRITKKIISKHVAGRMNFCGNRAKMGLNHTTVFEVIKGTAYFKLITTFGC